MVLVFLVVSFGFVVGFLFRVFWAWGFVFFKFC